MVDQFFAIETDIHILERGIDHIGNIYIPLCDPWHRNGNLSHFKAEGVDIFVFWCQEPFDALMYVEPEPGPFLFCFYFRCLRFHVR